MNFLDTDGIVQSYPLTRADLDLLAECDDGPPYKCVYGRRIYETSAFERWLSVGDRPTSKSRTSIASASPMTTSFPTEWRKPRKSLTPERHSRIYDSDLLSR